MSAFKRLNDIYRLNGYKIKRQFKRNGGENSVSLLRNLRVEAFNQQHKVKFKQLIFASVMNQFEVASNTK